MIFTWHKKSLRWVNSKLHTSMGIHMPLIRLYSSSLDYPLVIKLHLQKQEIVRVTLTKIVAATTAIITRFEIFFYLLFLLFLKDICNELASTYYLDIIPVFFLWENWLSIILVDCQISVVLRGTGEYVYEDQYCVKISYSYGCFSSVTYVKTSAADHTNKHTE